MEHRAYREFVENSRTPERVEQTISYLNDHLSKFLRKGERVLICFPCRDPGSLSSVFEQAVQRCGAVPVV